ncbi:sulfite exporter TauE/SafE family protein [Pseudovibrio sp. Ad26]|uniref:sulfite exporter TauE/SafE family protein n=1 Tax=Pseudovibrio sp. Ad26 TaxID=989410 RepID=UPI0007AECDAF|nr:sulfite exporter TauE/SafE family protein [Pseudovibrio sp. Ad26]KZL09035.1 Sulfite exporter TauE/SafE [Pseudovibrio sp. Ad26]
MEYWGLTSIATMVTISIAADVLGGILAGLLGVGGGIVIVPALYITLTQIAQVNANLAMQVAVATSLLTIVFTSLSSGIGHHKRGAIDFTLLKLWTPSIIVGVVGGALLGSIVSGYILIGIFSCVAALVAIDMIFRKTSSEVRQRSFSKPTWTSLGVLAGTISSMMGIGGGTVCVPLLNFLGYDIRRAVGTSAAIGFVISLPSAAVYAISGLGQEGLPPFSLGYINLLAAAIIIPLSTSFARIGVKIAHSIPRGTLRLVFGMFLAITSMRMFTDLVGS